MRTPFALIGLLVLGTSSLACAERVVVRDEPRGERCAGGEWVHGHRGPRGRWHEGHWRCPGVVEVVEVE